MTDHVVRQSLPNNPADHEICTLSAKTNTQTPPRVKLKHAKTLALSNYFCYLREPPNRAPWCFQRACCIDIAPLSRNCTCPC
jgi:hypothetical protein